MAQDMQLVTAYGDEATMEMQSLLLTFTQIRSKELIGAQQTMFECCKSNGY